MPVTGTARSASFRRLGMVPGNVHQPTAGLCASFPERAGTVWWMAVSIWLVDDLSVELSSGTDEWFDDLYRHHWAGMVRLAFAMVGEQAVAEDLAQVAFARVFRARDRVEDPLPYLRSAIYNACRNHHRAVARRRQRSRASAASEAPVGDHVVDVVRRLLRGNGPSWFSATTRA